MLACRPRRWREIPPSRKAYKLALTLVIRTDTTSGSVRPRRVGAATARSPDDACDPGGRQLLTTPPGQLLTGAARGALKDHNFRASPLACGAEPAVRRLNK
jgi:hypothetical protein